jgi:hypothetical protein
MWIFSVVDCECWLWIWTYRVNLSLIWMSTFSVVLVCELVRMYAVGLWCVSVTHMAHHRPEKNGTCLLGLQRCISSYLSFAQSLQALIANKPANTRTLHGIRSTGSYMNDPVHHHARTHTGYPAGWTAPAILFSASKKTYYCIIFGPWWKIKCCFV